MQSILDGNMLLIVTAKGIKAYDYDLFDNPLVKVSFDANMQPTLEDKDTNLRELMLKFNIRIIVYENSLEITGFIPTQRVNNSHNLRDLR